MKKSALTSYLVLIFLIGFAFAFGLTQNLPFTFGDDLDIIETARQTSWGHFLKQLVNPLTPRWVMFGAYNRLTTRVFQTLIFKILHHLGGLNPNLFWAVQSFAFAGIGCLIFFFLYSETGNRGLGFAGSLFFYNLRPTYRTLCWISDSELIAEFLLASAFFLFIRFYRKEDAKKTFSEIFLFFFISWLAMKTKETVRTIPVVALAFLAFHQNRNFFIWFQKSQKNKLTVGLLLLLLLTIIPWHPFQWPPSEPIKVNANSPALGFQLRLESLQALGAQMVKLFVPVAVSLTACFSLALWGSLPESSHRPRDRSILFCFFSIWAALCLAASVAGFDIKGHPRYMITALIPLTIFVWSLYQKPLESLWGGTSRWKKFLAILLVAVPIVFQVPLENGRMKIQSKMDEILFARNYFSGTDIADYLLTRKIVEDRFSIKEASWDDVGHFYHGKPPAHPGEFGGIRIKAWSLNEDWSLKRLERTRKIWGAVYILSFSNDLFLNVPVVKLLWEGTTDNGSFYSRWIPKIKKKTNRRIYLYKYSLPQDKPI